ncbi:MAG: hypothetical protein A3J37_06805 [Alphaproteobacteria bacterium RIFCSPHIGHO2_12_FULL_45_9]|nr:MAG: hypothetical protein A3B66_10450 [Alphaproteobacteria bacterium RIFCSPHIGHO2_02_FULL_46_13]OFW97063.1 MAG: hypothetical protein A3J37_06805 [Alphaproteobacteria bacterium RIFCSPHIGHO2_12_FULL_45_9]
MIEAVSAVVSNSQILRSIAEQTSTTQVLSANPSKIQSAAIIAPYLSPHVDYNGGNSKPIFVVRDAATGETLRQFPSEAQIRAYAKAAQVREQVMVQAQFQGSDSGYAEAAALRSADFAKSSIEFKVARQAVKQQTEPAVFKPAAAPSSYSTIGSSDSSQYKSVTSVDTQA